MPKYKPKRVPPTRKPKPKPSKTAKAAKAAKVKPALWP
jgi:hypothetical protein